MIRPRYYKRQCPANITPAALVMVFVFGMVAGYIVGLWHQIGQKAQRIEDEKILVAQGRME